MNGDQLAKEKFVPCGIGSFPGWAILEVEKENRGEISDILWVFYSNPH